MKIIKIFSVFFIMIASVIFISWILGMMDSQDALEMSQKSGAVMGVLFLTTLVLSSLTKPQTKTDQQNKK